MSRIAEVIVHVNYLDRDRVPQLHERREEYSAWTRVHEVAPNIVFMESNYFNREEFLRVLDTIKIRFPDCVQAFIKEEEADTFETLRCSALQVSALDGMTLEEREAFFDKLKDAYCLHCAEKQPEGPMRCQCWNDD